MQRSSLKRNAAVLHRRTEVFKRSCSVSLSVALVCASVFTPEVSAQNPTIVRRSVEFGTKIVDSLDGTTTSLDRVNTPAQNNAPDSAKESLSVSVRRPSLDSDSAIAPITSGASKSQDPREQMFNDLAEEVSMFDRLGNLVRRVSTLVKPSVIHIEAHKTEKNESFDEAGAGIVLAINGETWVMTNRHVIAGASPKQILLRTNDGRELHPVKVLSDASTDVAVMQITGVNLPPARLGNSDTTEIGDFVIAIGSPFGLSHSVTFGILSAKGRRDLSLGEQRIDLQDFFQTDAAINPGNSGGPLLNLRGEVVALNTAIASSSGGSEGIGFAIPMNMAMKVADQLVRFGAVRRGYLGVTLDPDFTVADLKAAGYSEQGGALVKNVRPGSPAEVAHLQRGDIIVEFSGEPVDNDDHLVARVGLTPIGSKIPMIIYRDGKRYRTEVVLTDM